MKTHLIILIFSFLFLQANLWGQQTEPSDQNPNYRRSLEKYQTIKDSLLQNMGETIQDTYKAIDPIQDKIDAREARRAFRRDLRLERARAPRVFIDRGWNNWGYDPYGFGFNRWNRWNRWGNNWNNNFYGGSRFNYFRNNWGFGLDWYYWP